VANSGLLGRWEDLNATRYRLPATPRPGRPVLYTGFDIHGAGSENALWFNTWASTQRTSRPSPSVIVEFTVCVGVSGHGTCSTGQKATFFKLI